MPNLFSKSSWLLFLQVAICFGRPWPNIESGMISPCTTKFVVVDDVKNNADLTIQYGICHIDESIRPTCFVSNNTDQLCDGDPIQDAEIIQEAQFVDENGKTNHVSHDSRQFSVSLKGEDFTTQGIYNYSVSYYYETACDDERIGPPTSCHGWISMSLIIVVTDVRLTVTMINDEVLMWESEIAATQKKFQVKKGGSADLECSLELARHLNMQLEFVFTSANSNATKTVLCDNESNQRVDNWVVTPNMDDNTCHLKIVNFSEADAGQYDCLMIIINSHTAYNEDKSNPVSLVAEPSNSENVSWQLAIAFFYGLLFSTISILAVVSLILVGVIRRYRSRRPNRTHARPAVGSGYGSTGTTSPGIISQASRLTNSSDHRGIDGEPIIYNFSPCPTDIGENDSEAETVFSGTDTDTNTHAASPLITESERESRKDQALPSRSVKSNASYMSDGCATKTDSSSAHTRNVMSENEATYHRRKSIPLSMDDVSSRLPLYLKPVGYELVPRHESASKPSQTEGGTADSRPCHEEPDPPQSSGQNTEAMDQMFSLPDSDSSSSTGRSSASNLSSGKNSPDANEQQPAHSSESTTGDVNLELNQEQRGDSCKEND